VQIIDERIAEKPSLQQTHFFPFSFNNLKKAITGSVNLPFYNLGCKLSFDDRLKISSTKRRAMSKIRV
jgi:hypothetical protein